MSEKFKKGLLDAVSTDGLSIVDKVLGQQPQALPGMEQQGEFPADGEITYGENLLNTPQMQDAVLADHLAATVANLRGNRVSDAEKWEEYYSVARQTAEILLARIDRVKTGVPFHELLGAIHKKPSVERKDDEN